MNQPLIVFDMDGVLVDVTESYRVTIQQTVKHFTGGDIRHEAIQDFKNQGGWNDDWKLSHHIINGAGVAASLTEVTEYFQGLFLGQNGTDGLMRREKWVARPGVLEKLNREYRFAVFTGRMKHEAKMTLDRFAPELVFDPMIGMHDVENLKPAPDGLLKIRAANPDTELVYVGDTVDDARSARAAGVPFVGITSPENTRYVDLVFLFQEEKAIAIIDDINYLEEALHA
jgi:HAD superfamily phosphatase